MNSISRSEIPLPDNSGSDGTQISTVSHIEELQENPLGSLPLVREIEGIAGRGRGFGSDVSNALILGAMRTLDGQNRQLLSDLRGYRERLETRTTELAASSQREAVLRERIRLGARSRKLANAAVVIGTLIFGIGIDLLTNDKLGLGVAGVVVGIVLVLLAWSSAPMDTES